MDEKRVVPIAQEDVVKSCSTAISRRDALRWVGSAVAAAPLASLLACDSGSNEVEMEDDAVADPRGTTRDGSVVASDGSSSARGDRAAAGDGAAVRWASGGTAALAGLASYPNPFESPVNDACTPSCRTTIGPCHDHLAAEREDVSDGRPGLPLRFGLRIVDTDCQPVANANVDIWHCDTRGVYSSDTTDLVVICGTGGDPEALTARWFRGHRMTDENGVAWFNTCFPGWYSGRVVHIHFIVRRSSRAGEEYLTSQVGFSEALVNEIFSEHPDYMEHGLPDTRSTADSVFPEASVEQYFMETQRMPDGAMLAWKTIMIRSALSEEVCVADDSPNMFDAIANHS